MAKPVMFFLTFVVVLLLVLTYITTRFIDQEEIHRAELEMASLHASRDSLLAFVATRESLQVGLLREADAARNEAEALRENVAQLEELRKQERLSVRFLRKKEDLFRKLESTYPEMARSKWGVKEVYDDANDVSVEYFMIPLWFTETFIIEHQDAANYRAQRDSLWSVDSLQRKVNALTLDVLNLEREKSAAYKSGYDEAYSKYEELNKAYIDLLKKPPSVELGLPAWGTILGSAGAGFVLGTVVGK